MLRDQLRKEEEMEAAAQEEQDALELQKRERAISQKRMSIVNADMISNPDSAEEIEIVSKNHDVSLNEEAKRNLDENSRLNMPLPDGDFRTHPAESGRSMKSD